ncbi:MAG TPA: hypothetical protein VHK27_05645 [Gammaproteobacteria bacterium]|nr:hypothetical protein [Gammaproteobacteria bacterium]
MKGAPRTLANARKRNSSGKVSIPLQMPVQNPAAAADVAALKTQFDALLTKLKDAGLMATS